MKMKRRTFETFRIRGRRFLAIPINRDDVAIMDEEGNNYGAWQDESHFSEKYRDGEESPIGRCYPQTAHGENLSCHHEKMWQCECGCEETWFDRTLTYNEENHESCMVYRCKKCGKEAK
jgi:hypothetical protein